MDTIGYCLGIYMLMDNGLLLLSFLLLKNSSTGLSINKLVNYLINYSKTGLNI